MDNKEIVKIVSKYVKDISEKEESAHDWWHIQRVYRNAMLINRKEQANEFVITMIALMHDLYDPKFYKEWNGEE